MFKTILAPIDLSDLDTAATALEHATMIAQSSEGSVRLVYVRSEIPVTWREFVPPHFDTEQQQEAEEKLARVAAGVDLPEDRVSSVVHMGAVHAEVLKEADRVGADLIVVGSHQPSHATYLLGSSATVIVRHARCSVLVVRR
jgi:nucleotide-binding universal stress UspA family protein